MPTPFDPALFLHRPIMASLATLGARETGNVWFIETIARIENLTGRLMRLAPESVFTNDVSFFRTGPDLARQHGELT